MHRKQNKKWKNYWRKAPQESLLSQKQKAPPSSKRNSFRQKPMPNSYNKKRMRCKETSNNSTENSANSDNKSTDSKVHNNVLNKTASLFSFWYKPTKPSQNSNKKTRNYIKNDPLSEHKSPNPKKKIHPPNP